jgi:hypothetical protein
MPTRRPRARQGAARKRNDHDHKLRTGDARRSDDARRGIRRMRPTEVVSEADRLTGTRFDRNVVTQGTLTGLSQDLVVALAVSAWRQLKLHVHLAQSRQATGSCSRQWLMSQDPRSGCPRVGIVGAIGAGADGAAEMLGELGMVFTDSAYRLADRARHTGSSAL